MTNGGGEPSVRTLLPVVAAALLDGERRVLVQRRPEGKSFAGLWEFPGGKVESGESPEHALVRELAEELGIVIDPDALSPIAFASEPAGDRHLVLLLYLVRSWQGEPRALEASALAWHRCAALRLLPMPPADRPLIALLERCLREGC